MTLRDGASFDVRRGSRGGSENSCLKVFTIARRAAKSDGATASSYGRKDYEEWSGHEQCQESYEKYSGY